MKRTTKKALIIFGSGLVILIGLLLIGSWLFSLTVDSAEKHLRLGKQLRLEGRHDEAATKFQHAVTVDPTNSEAWYYLAINYEEIGRRQEAISAWQKYVELARGHPEEELDVKFALSHLDALEHPEKYSSPPPQPLSDNIKPFDLNRDQRLDGFDWNGLGSEQKPLLLGILGVPTERISHLLNRVNDFYLSDRVTRRLLNLNEDLYSTDPNIKITDVVDQYIVMSDFIKMSPGQKDAFLTRNKIEPEEMNTVKGILENDGPAISANIRARDEVYYLLDWGLFDRDYKVRFITQIGLAKGDAEKLVTEMDLFYQNPAYRYLRLDEVYRKLR